MKLSIRAKLILVTGILLLVGTLINTTIPIYFYERALYTQLDIQAEELADVIRGSHHSSSLATDVAEKMLEDQLLGTAQVLAYLFATGELDQATVMEIAQSTAIDEIYITDSDGVTIFSNNPGGVGWRFPTDPTAQAFPFRALLNSRSGKVTQEVTIRDLDGQAFKFVGVSSIHTSGIIQVGVSAESLNQIMDRIGMQATIEQVIDNEEMLYAFVVDKAGNYLYHPERSQIGQKYQALKLENAYEYQAEIDDQGNILVLGISMAEFLDAQLIARYSTIFFALIFIALAVIIVWIWSGTFVKSIKNLINRIAALASGDFTIEIKTNNKDEIGDAFQALEQLKNDVGRVLGNTLATAGSLATSSAELSAATEETSATIEEVASTSNEFANTVENISANAQSMANTVEIIAGHAGEGEKAIEDSVVKTMDLKNRITKLADSVHGLGERSREVGTIVELITNIADQTNLLALNAAIEAARAGEHGRGFAVVAEEVRALAEQSARAADNIGDLIEAIQNEADGAVQGISESAIQADTNAKVVSESGKLIKEILDAMEAVIKEVTMVSEGTQDLQSGSQQLAAATEEQSATMQEVATLANGLNQMSEKLQEVVNLFKI